MIGGQQRFVVITGGPGSGKSTLIDALAARGFARTVEAGRAIIQEQVASGGTALPWSDPRAFAERMFEWELRSYAEARKQDGVVFFDRGVPDVVGYLRLLKLAVPAHMDAAIRTHLYDASVFVAPPWPDIFTQDAERKQTLDEAQRTYDALVATYAGYGYALIELPRVSVAERVAFVLGHVLEHPPGHVCAQRLSKAFC
jgi:predicted ATPase